MTEKPLSELDKKVLKLLDPDGSWYRMQLIFDIGEVEGVSHITVQRKIKELRDRGFIERWHANKNLKGVYYRRCEDVRIEKLIEDTLQDISDTLDQLPGEYSDLEKQLRAGAGEKTVEVLRSEPSFLKTMILTSLDNKILALLNANLSEKRKGKFCYKRKLVRVDAATSSHLPV